MKIGFGTLGMECMAWVVMDAMSWKRKHGMKRQMVRTKSMILCHYFKMSYIRYHSGEVHDYSGTCKENAFEWGIDFSPLYATLPLPGSSRFCV